MPQSTDLNVAPYYDDFDKDKNFVRTLFRPGFAIQARELTQLQSTLQNEISSVGWLIEILNHYSENDAIIMMIRCITVSSHSDWFGCNVDRYCISIPIACDYKRKK